MSQEQSPPKGKKKRLWLWIALGLLLVPLLGLALLTNRMRRDMAQFPVLLKDAGIHKPILLRNASVYPGMGKERLTARDVLVSKGKIQQIAAGGTLATKGRHVIEARGMTLLPGLIDAHVHLLSSGSAPWKFLFGSLQHNAQAYLRSGITTVFELGGMAAQSLKARKQIKAGRWLGPRIYCTDQPITTPGGHPIPVSRKLLPWPLGALASLGATQIGSPQEAPKLIAALRQKKADYVKIIYDQLPPGSPQMEASRLKALIREAKKYNFLVFVHIGSAKDAVVAAQAGADVLAHGVYRDELSPQDAQKIAKTGARMIFTLAGFQQTLRMARGQLQFSAYERALHPAILREPILAEKGKAFGRIPVIKDFVAGLVKGEKHWERNVQRARAAGIPFLIGTDSALPAVFPGSSYLLELQALHKAGIPIHELLEAATSKAATLLHKKPNYGRVRVGAIADLLLVRGNPLKDLRKLQDIRAVLRRGRLVKVLQ